MATAPTKDDQPKTHRELSAENVEARLDALYANLEAWGTQLADKLDTDQIGKLNAMLTEMAALAPSRPTHAPLAAPNQVGTRASQEQAQAQPQQPPPQPPPQPRQP